jgi:hypothetical protein
MSFATFILVYTAASKLVTFSTQNFSVLLNKCTNAMPNEPLVSAVDKTENIYVAIYRGTNKCDVSV